ncbi:TonB-linked outer membrane protein, SusC/RagA family [Fodinibius roseus]|uniref:TonB-linked outer membrane protein, SusC/RagA family n=1 Tax=Fodinibius roseus TaxID=1194090 RepID=A0A1M5HV79_9BACT|nr:SusC/RagA family TonB-linked outer membrane protein [Fodinibius roseus]SHG19793.1 TonB-linked outer membrane protein, SusC/RagA family [Fodinibius roseus]
MKKGILSLACLLLLPIAVQAQEVAYTISGMLVDERTEEPLAGANISFENTTIGTSADADGHFELTAQLEPGAYNLQITFIGYRRVEREINLGDEQEITLGTIELRQDVIGSEEVVITGASVLTSKKQIGNSISTVNADELQGSGATQIDQALAGKISGALIQQNSGNPAGGISVRLRGAGTFLGQASPLYIVDGVIVNNDSPELIDVGGTATNRLVDLNPEDIERIEVVKGAAAAALYGSRANNGVVQIFTKRGTSGKPEITYSSKVNIDHVRKTLDVNMAMNDQGQFLDNSGNVMDGKRYDFQDFIFRTAMGTDQYLSIGGGSGDTRYFMSGSYKNNQGIVKATNFERATARLNLDQALADWADISMKFNYSNSRSNEIPNGGLNSSYGALTGFIFGPNTVDPRPDPVSGEYPNNTVLANPLEVIDVYDFNQEVNRVLGGATLTLLPLEGLSIDHTLGIDTYSQVATAFIPNGTSAPGLTTGFGRRSEREFFQINNDLNLRYQKSLTPSIESTSLLGGTVQYEKTATTGIQAEEFTLGSRVVTGGADFDQPGEFRSETVIYGVFAQQTIGINERYFVTGAGRFDASSVFGKSERWQFFPKVSGSWLVSEEAFWQRSGIGEAVSSFKLRASLGTSGGQTAIGAFDRFNLFNPSSVNGRSALLPSTQRGALNVKPERQTELELGLDANFLSDRLTLEFTYYNQKTEDLLLFRTTAPSTGYLSQLGNFGSLDNTGFEVLLKGVPVNNNHLQWTSTVTFAANENEIRGIEGGVIIIPESFSQVAAINGEPLGVFYSDAFERDASGNIVKDEDALPVEAEGDHIIGDPNPDWNGSFINEVSIGRNWNFRAQLDVTYGNDVFNFTERLGSLGAFGTMKTYERELEGDLPEGYNARVFGIFENWIEDGSFVKLREMSASYTLYPEVLGLRSLRFSVIGRNLFSIDSYNGYDPETNVAGQRTAVRGFDFVQVPIPRSIIFGVTANF